MGEWYPHHQHQLIYASKDFFCQTFYNIARQIYGMVFNNKRQGFQASQKGIQQIGFDVYGQSPTCQEGKRFRTSNGHWCDLAGIVVDLCQEETAPAKNGLTRPEAASMARNLCCSGCVWNVFGKMA